MPAAGLPHHYAGLHLPSFVYSLWLPAAVANSPAKFGGERTDVEVPYANGYCRTSPPIETTNTATATIKRGNCTATRSGQVHGKNDSYYGLQIMVFKMIRITDYGS